MPEADIEGGGTLPSRTAVEHDEVGPVTRALEILSLAVAALLLAGNIVRLFRASALTAWWVPFAIVAAAFVADLVRDSSIGRPIPGAADVPVDRPAIPAAVPCPPRQPARLLRRDSIDCNGDVAMLNIPILAAALLLPLANRPRTVAAVALVAFCAVGAADQPGASVGAHAASAAPGPVAAARGRHPEPRSARASSRRRTSRTTASPPAGATHGSRRSDSSHRSSGLVTTLTGTRAARRRAQLRPAPVG